MDDDSEEAEENTKDEVADEDEATELVKPRAEATVALMLALIES